MKLKLLQARATGAAGSSTRHSPKDVVFLRSPGANMPKLIIVIARDSTSCAQDNFYACHFAGFARL